ncbi:hypothetical protein [Pectobacterium brasiliense]|uniref:hypothetical protein n=1 Tax=Pectobacterium brasiliense TaxID=180957 RepID=UPI002A80BE9A|nr:hypothetical protein [Pectobacterium brasiliense]MDY4347176.1 hypothetical protein [Pectobacterium brasiliense]
MNNNAVIPFSEIESSKVDLNQAVKQGQQMTETLKKMGIKEATFDSGAYYKHDQDTNTTTLAADGILMKQNEHTTTVIFRNEGSTEQQALEELSSSSMTQKTLGAFSGVSQQRASQLLLDDNK